MFAAIWYGFCNGLGFCLAVALTVGFTELRTFSKNAYDSNVLAWRKRQQARADAKAATTPVYVPAAPAPAPVQQPVSTGSFPGMPDTNSADNNTGNNT